MYHIYRTHYEKKDEDTVDTSQIYHSYQEEEEDVDTGEHEVSHTTQQMIEADI